MRKYVLLIALVAMCSLTGCDFFRELAGRPTSEDIEELRLEKLRVEEERLQASLAKLEQEKKAVADSIEAMKFIRQQSGTLLNPSALGGLYTTRLEARYCVIVGAFEQRSNAERLHKEASEKGYSPLLISFRSGLIAVGIGPADSLPEVMQTLRKVKEETFCPDDVWILDNE